MEALKQKIKTMILIKSSELIPLAKNGDLDQSVKHIKKPSAKRVHKV